MLALNFYKIRTGLDIRPLDQGGDRESQLRYEQIIQTISANSEIEWIADRIYEIDEDNPIDLGFYKKVKIRLRVLVFGVNKRTSSWTASSLKMALGNMKLPYRLKELNPNAEPWIGGKENNISCEKALFNLRPVKRSKNN